MRVRSAVVLVGVVLVSLGLFLFFGKSNQIVIGETEDPGIDKSSEIIVTPPTPKIVDIEPQKPLANPPEKIKAIYSTSWSAASEKKLTYLTKLIKDTELNAIVIDMKDFTGYLTYNSDL
ncbi:MAG: putative glycoside hydrolase, partial [bacterium]|nr:putative glycoside hydrolase [bacterium]